jgi:hypothetical protein
MSRAPITGQEGSVTFPPSTAPTARGTAGDYTAPGAAAGYTSTQGWEAPHQGYLEKP